MTTTVQTVSLSLVKLRGPFYSPQLAVRSRLGRRSQQPGAWRAAHGAEARVAATLQAGRGIEPEAGASQRELRWTPHALLCSWFYRGCPPRVLCRRAAADPAKAHGPGCRRARYPFRGSHRCRLRPVCLDQGTVRLLPAWNTGAAPCTGAAVSAPRVTERPPLPGARQLPARSRHALLEALHRQVRRQPEHAVHVERPAAGRPAAPQPDVVAREGGRGRAARARAAARRVLLLHHFRTLHATPRQAAPALQLAGRFGQQRPPLTLTPTPTPTLTSTPTLTLTLT